MQEAQTCSLVCCGKVTIFPLALLLWTWAVMCQYSEERGEHLVLQQWDLFLLSSPAEARSSVHFWAPQDKRELLESGQESVTERVKGQEHLCCEKRLMEPGLLSLEEAQFWPKCRNTWSELERRWSQALSLVPSDKRRGSGHKLKHRRVHLNIRKCSHCVRVPSTQSHRVPREAAESPSKGFKSHLGIFLSNQLSASCFSRAVGQKDSRGPFQLQPFWLCDMTCNKIFKIQWIYGLCYCVKFEPGPSGFTQCYDSLFCLTLGLVGLYG